MESSYDVIGITVSQRRWEKCVTLNTTHDGVVSQASREAGMPGPAMTLPNRETLEAIEEPREILAHPEKYKGFTVDEAFKELGL